MKIEGIGFPPSIDSGDSITVKILPNEGDCLVISVYSTYIECVTPTLETLLQSGKSALSGLNPNLDLEINVNGSK